MQIAPGLEFGKYRIIESLGAGGMGEVFLAEDLTLGRKVAIKFISQRWIINPELRARFTREAEIAASLSHPNVVTIHEVGQCDDRPYLVMEYVSGKNLSELARESPLSAVAIIDIASQIASGLAEIHSRGLTHRDIKSANIVVTESGRVKILDFGLAKPANDSQLTEPGVITGSISYMSPEQLSGEAAQASSDLFSLGVVLYELSTGQLPFRGEYEAAIIYAIANTEPDPPASLRKDIPAELSYLIMRLMSKIPSRRFTNAEELQQAIRLLGTNTDTMFIRRPRSDRGLRILGLGVIVFLAVVFLLWRIEDVPDSNNLRSDGIAVLPFENLGEPGDLYFADGMTAEVITDLCKIGRLNVIARTSSMRYRNTELSTSQIAEELDVQYLLTGTVLWDKSAKPNRLKVGVNLVDAQTNLSIWGQSYERTLESVFSIQSDIAGDVAKSLQIFVDDSLRQQPLTENLWAYDYYLRGNEYFYHTWENEDIRAAIQMYERAIGLDSSFAEAYAMLSRSYASLYWEHFDRTTARCNAAESAARRALALRSDLAEGRLALGYYYYHCVGDYSSALQQFQTALALSPNNSDIYNAIAAVQRRLSKFEDAAGNFHRSLQLDPRSHQKAFDLGITFGMMRSYDQAEQFMDRTIDLAPDWPLAHIYKAWIPILARGDTATAHRQLEAALPEARLNQNKYCWWLHRVIDSKPEHLLRCVSLGSDTIAYYLQMAQIYRLMHLENPEHACADTARALAEILLPTRPDDAQLNSYLGLAYAGLRMPEKAFTFGNRSVELLPANADAFDAPFWLVNLAETMVIFGKYEEAISLLETLLSIPGFVSPAYLALDPLWAPLHDNPRFQKLLIGFSKNP